MKFRNLRISKILNIGTNRIFPVPFKVMYISLRYVILLNGAIKTILSLFIFFFGEKVSRAQKVQKRKTNDFYPLKSLCVREKLLPLLFSVNLFLFLFC